MASFSTSVLECLLGTAVLGVRVVDDGCQPAYSHRLRLLSLTCFLQIFRAGQARPGLEATAHTVAGASHDEVISCATGRQKYAGISVQQRRHRSDRTAKIFSGILRKTVSLDTTGPRGKGETNGG